MSMNTASYENSGTGYVPLDDVIKEVLSKEILRAAMPETVFLQAVVQKEDLNREAGLQIDMVKFGALEKGGALSEHIPIPTNNLESSTVSITVGERGNAVAASNLLIQAGRVDILMEAATALGEDAGLVLDTEVRDSFYNSSNTLFAGTGSTQQSHVQASDILTYEMIDTIIERASRLHSRPFIAPNGERYYVMFIHPRHFTQLKRQVTDNMERFNRLTYVKDYPAGRPVWRGEIAQIDNIKLISTPLVKQAIDATETWSYDATLVGTSSSDTLLTAVFSGYNGVGFAVREPLSFRENGVEDFGRIRKLAWYSIWGSGLVNEESTMLIYTGSDVTAST